MPDLYKFRSVLPIICLSCLLKLAAKPNYLAWSKDWQWSNYSMVNLHKIWQSRSPEISDFSNWKKLYLFSHAKIETNHTTQLTIEVYADCALRVLTPLESMENVPLGRGVCSLGADTIGINRECTTWQRFMLSGCWYHWNQWRKHALV